MSIKVAFISRHSPSDEQIKLAAQAGMALDHVGDADAFNATELYDKSGFYDYVCVVHPAAALFLMPHKGVIVFKNESRSEPGQPPKFSTTEMHVFHTPPQEPQIFKLS
jgi:hypothetical protein